METWKYIGAFMATAISLYLFRSGIKRFIAGFKNLVFLTFVFTKFPNYKAMHMLFKKNGPLMIIRLPFLSKPFIIIGELALGKKIAAAPTWAYRFKNDHFMSTYATSNQPVGIVWGNGENYRANRTFVTKMLTDLEFYSLANLQALVQIEVKEINKQLGEIVDQGGAAGYGTFAPRHFYQLASANVMFQTMFGRRFDPDDEEMSKVLEVLNIVTREANLGGTVLELFPWARHIPGIKYIPGLTFLDKFRKFSEVFSQFIQVQLMDKRRQLGAYKINPRDLADYYLLEIDKNSQTEPKHFTDLTMKVVWRDMFIGGSDTTGKTLEWATLFMALNPAVQAKVHAVIDEIVGRHRVPIYDDKAKMPYVEAVILEILRLGTIGPAIARCPIENVSLAGEKIPEGSVCGISVYSIHRDEKIWDDPLAFRPERFLSEDGTRVINKEKIIPFGYGTRICIGKYVATISLFIFFTSIMQKFHFELSPDHPPPAWKSEIAVTRPPPPFHAKVSSRSLPFLQTEE